MNIVLRRLVLPIALFLAWAPVAHAWSWPVQGPVLPPFVYDQAHPYEAGQHRGIDIGADAEDQSVTAPAAGTVSFAGTVPTSGMCVTIQTSDGYSVTLTHLGSLLVAKGTTVAEGDAVGTIGPSGTPEFARPYVHLGIRTTSDPNGYLDPLGFLPVVTPADPTPSQSAPAHAPAPAAGRTAKRAAHGSSGRQTRTDVRSHRDHGRVSRPGTSESAVGENSTVRASSAPSATHRRQSGERPTEDLSSGPRVRSHVPLPHRGLDYPARRPVVAEVTGSNATSLDAAQKTRPGAHVSPVSRPGSLLPLVLNGVPALVALAAAFAVARRRRGDASGSCAGPLSLQLSPLPVEPARVRQAA